MLCRDRASGRVAIRTPDGPELIRWFDVRGLIDGDRVWAHWESGVLAADAPLRRRIEPAGDAPRRARARREWDDQVAALLARLTRACDEVESIDVGLAHAAGADRR